MAQYGWELSLNCSTDLFNSIKAHQPYSATFRKTEWTVKHALACFSLTTFDILHHSQSCSRLCVFEKAYCSSDHSTRECDAYSHIQKCMRHLFFNYTSTLAWRTSRSQMVEFSSFFHNGFLWRKSIWQTTKATVAQIPIDLSRRRARTHRHGKSQFECFINTLVNDYWWLMA